jgi:hypothetical protein
LTHNRRKYKIIDLLSQIDCNHMIGEMGARGARLAQGKWEVCVESTMRDSIFLATTASEAEAAEVHDM